VLIANEFAPPVGTPITLLAFGNAHRLSSDFATENGLGVALQQFSTLTYDSKSLMADIDQLRLAGNGAASKFPVSVAQQLAARSSRFWTPIQVTRRQNFTVTIEFGGDDTPLDTTTGAVT